MFVVTGGFRMGPGVTIPRNMTVVRQGQDLIVINSVRLTDEGEAALAALGTVRHVVRIGAGHGADDPYYAQRYGAPVWAPAGITQSPEIQEPRELSETKHPFTDGSSVFVFAYSKRPEAVVILPVEGGVLVTCDAYQHWANYDGCSALAKVVAKLAGFGPTVIGPMWLKKAGREVARDFEALGGLRFRHLVPGHGNVLRDGAFDGLRTALGKAKL